MYSEQIFLWFGIYLITVKLILKKHDEFVTLLVLFR